MTKFRLEPHLLQSLNLFCIGGQYIYLQSGKFAK